MSEHNNSLIIMMVVTMVLLFISMVLSSMASSASDSCKDENAHKYSMYSAITSGVAVLVTGVALWMYIYRDQIISSAGDILSSAGNSIKAKKV